MIIGYCRVSSKEQSQDSEALEQQKARVAPFCDEIITDVMSRSTVSRPGLNRLRELIKAGKCTKVVCTRLDRFGTLALVPEIKQLKKRGCEVFFLDYDLDPSTAAGELQANMMGMVSQYEVAQLAERVRHGIDYFQSQGKSHKAPFGYVVNDKHRLEFDQVPCVCVIETREALSRYDIARKIIEWYLAPPPDADGKRRSSLTRTIQLFNKTFGVQQSSSRRGRPAIGAIRFSKSGLARWLSSKVLLGHTVYGAKGNRPETIIRDTHPALITEDEARAIASSEGV